MYIITVHFKSGTELFGVSEHPAKTVADLRMVFGQGVTVVAIPAGEFLRDRGFEPDADLTTVLASERLGNTA